MKRLPEHCAQELIAQVAAAQVSKLVAQRYPNLVAAMKRALTLQKRTRPGTNTNVAAYQSNAQDALGSDRDVTRELALGKAAQWQRD